MKKVEIVITGDQSAGKSSIAALIGHLLKHAHPRSKVSIIHEGRDDLEELLRSFSQLSVCQSEDVEITIIDDNRARNSPSLNYVRGLAKNALWHVPTPLCRLTARSIRRWIRESSMCIRRLPPNE